MTSRSLALVLVLSLAACGGSTDTPPTPPTSVATPPISVATPLTTTVEAPPQPAEPTPMPVGACRFVPEGGIPIVPNRQAPRIVAGPTAIVVTHRNDTRDSHFFEVAARLWNEDAAILPLPLGARLEPVAIREPIDGEDGGVYPFRVGDAVGYVSCERPTGHALACEIVRQGGGTPVPFTLDESTQQTAQSIAVAGGDHDVFVALLTGPRHPELLLRVAHTDGTITSSTVTVELPYDDCREIGMCPMSIRADGDARAIISFAPERAVDHPPQPFSVTVAANGAVEGDPIRGFTAPRFGRDLALGPHPRNRIGVWVAGPDAVAIEGMPETGIAATGVPWHDGWLVSYDADVSALHTELARILLAPQPHVVGDRIPAGPRRDAGQGGGSVSVVGDHAYVAWEAPIDGGHEVRLAELVCDR